jgi:hypothetical protein
MHNRGNSWFDGLTTNGARHTEIKYLAVRPELRRRAPVNFLHSLTIAIILAIDGDRGLAKLRLRIIFTFVTAERRKHAFFQRW